MSDPISKPIDRIYSPREDIDLDPTDFRLTQGKPLGVPEMLPNELGSPTLPRRLTRPTDSVGCVCKGLGCLHWEFPCSSCTVSILL